MRSLDTRNFFATDFFSWSTLWLVSTVTEKLPPVVVLMFNVIWLPVANADTLCGCWWWWWVLEAWAVDLWW